jgi:ATP phosphoribosyltransferase
MDSQNRVLRIGLPSGSLQEPTFALFAKAGFHISAVSRSYKPAVDDPKLIIRVLRAQEISRYVEHGFLDCGLTGLDWIENNASDVARLCAMTFSKASNQPTRWVIAVPEDSTIRSVKDLQGKTIAYRSRGNDGAFSCATRSERDGRVFLGCDGSEGPRSCGRNCRCNRNRVVAARKQIKGA